MSMLAHLLQTQTRRDAGPVRHVVLHMEWSFAPGASGTTPLRVSYQVNYPSVWHRGRGIDPEIRIHSIEREIKDEWVPAQLDAAQEEAVREALEQDESLNAPLADC